MNRSFVYKLHLLELVVVERLGKGCQQPRLFIAFEKAPYLSSLSWVSLLLLSGLSGAVCPLQKSTSLFGQFSSLKHSTSSIWSIPLACDDSLTESMEQIVTGQKTVASSLECGCGFQNTFVSLCLKDCFSWVRPQVLTSMCSEKGKEESV